MAQTQTDLNKTSSLGAAAAAAATPTTNGSKPAATPPATGTTPAAAATDADTDASADDAAEGSTEEAKRSRKVFIVVGEVHEFDSVAKAEKFLNGEGAPRQYTVLKGNRVVTNTKISLR